MLANIISLMANALDSGLGVTLMVHGAVITGTLVGEREYLRGVNNLFKAIARDTFEGMPEETLRAFEETLFFNELTEDDNDLPPDSDTAGDADEPSQAALSEPPLIRHLHLRDPIIIYPSSTLSFRDSALPFMRLRLAAVDGWMLGRINVMSDDDDFEGSFNRYDDSPPGRIH